MSGFSRYYLERRTHRAGGHHQGELLQAIEIIAQADFQRAIEGFQNAICHVVAVPRRYCKYRLGVHSVEAMRHNGPDGGKLEPVRALRQWPLLGELGGQVGADRLQDGLEYLGIARHQVAGVEIVIAATKVADQSAGLLHQ